MAADPIHRRRKKSLESPSLSPTSAPLPQLYHNRIKITYSPRMELETRIPAQEIPATPAKMNKKKSSDTVVAGRYRVLESVGCRLLAWLFCFTSQYGLAISMSVCFFGSNAELFIFRRELWDCLPSRRPSDKFVRCAQDCE